MNDYIFKIVSFSGWTMQIYIDVFFPCSQRELLKVIKLIKESGTINEGQELRELYEKIRLYHYNLSADYEHEKLCKNEELIMKKLNEARR